MHAQQFTSKFLFDRAVRSMKGKGYAVATLKEWCGLIEVTWRKII